MESAGFYIAEAGEEGVSPSPAPHSLTGMQREEKVSGIYPAVQHGRPPLVTSCQLVHGSLSMSTAQRGSAIEVALRVQHRGCLGK